MPATNLYFVTRGDQDGSDLDMFVEATDALEAVRLWRGWTSQFAATWELPPEPKVYRLPQPSGVSRLLGWRVPGGVEAVFPLHLQGQPTATPSPVV